MAGEGAGSPASDLCLLGCEGRALVRSIPARCGVRRYNHLVLARSQIQEVFPLAACSRLAENSRLGFAPVASTSRWASGFSISSSTLGLSASLYDGRVRPRSTGKERDAESGNDYFGARYYASSMGRFMSPDKPFADQHPANPQSWNLYSYTRNNPLRFVDDDGEKVNEAPTVIVTYHVSGGTAAEAWNNAPAASGISGGYRGNTDTNIGVGNYSFDTSSKSIGTTTTVTDTLTSADVNLSVTITLPAWDGYSSATPAEQQQWDSLAGGLKDHEDGHKTIAEQGANALDKSLPGTSATGTGNGLPGAQKSAADALGQKVEDKHQGAVQNTQQNQDAYDKRTDHGAKPDPNKPN